MVGGIFSGKWRRTEGGGGGGKRIRRGGTWRGSMRDLGPSEHGETRTACDFGPVKGEEEDGRGRGGDKNKTIHLLLHSRGCTKERITETMLRAGYGNKESSVDRRMCSRDGGGRGD